MPLTIWYRPVYHVLLGHGNIIPVRVPWVTRPWITDHVVQGYIEWITRLWTRSTGLWNWVTVPWIILYQAIDRVEQICAPCATGPWTWFTGPRTICYQVLEHIVPGHWPCGKRLFTMCYRTVGHGLTCSGPYCIWHLIIWYSTLYHVLLSCGLVLLGWGPCINGLWIIFTRTLNMSYWVMDNQLLSTQTYCIGTSATWYRVVYHVLPGPCVCSTVKRTHSTTHWTIYYWPIDHMVECCVTWATMPYSMSYQELEHIVPGHWTCSSGLCCRAMSYQVV